MPCFLQTCAFPIGLAHIKSSHQHFIDREQQECSTLHLKACYQVQNFPPLGNAVRAPPPVTNLPVTTQISKWSPQQRANFLCSISIPKASWIFFFHQHSFFPYPETRPLTADTVLIFLFSVIPSVAAVSSPLYFKAVRLMLKKPASVSYHELSQASF